MILGCRKIYGSRIHVWWIAGHHVPSSRCARVCVSRCDVARIATSILLSLVMGWLSLAAALGTQVEPRAGTPPPAG